MRIATWNINGVKARIDGLLTWLKSTSPDVVCLQEIKSVTEAFPRLEIEALGYNVAVHGQKGFNGVALLSKSPLEDVRIGLPGEPDAGQSRYIEAVVSTPSRAVRVASLYLPNGNPIAAVGGPLVAGTLKSTQIYNPATNSYSTGPSSNGIHNESVWTKLPDQSILFVDRGATTSDRYVPSRNVWMVDGPVPVALFDTYGLETGGAALLEFVPRARGNRPGLELRNRGRSRGNAGAAGWRHARRDLRRPASQPSR